MADRAPNYPGEQGPGIDHSLPPVNSSPPVVEKGPAPQDQSGSQYIEDADISNKAFRFNPPLHASSMSRRVDFGGTSNPIEKWNDEAADSPKGDYTEKWAKEGLNTLRLGRIIQHYKAPGRSGLLKYRWGFRFLYNPTTVTYASTRNDSFVIDPRSESNRVLSGVFQNFQTVSFTVLLDRTPDIMSGIKDESQYSPRLRSGDRSGLLRYGTHWDLEALFKICNGEWDLTDRGKTSNIGTLLPSNARLVLGPGVNFFGFISAVTWKDELFSPSMVPMRTRVDISFKRHVDMTSEQATESFPGIASADDGSSTPSEGSGEGIVDNGQADSHQGNSNQAPVPGYNRVTTPYGKKGSIWSSGVHLGDDYGMGGVSGKMIVATRPGTVTHVGTSSRNSWAGIHVIVKTGDVEHWYCHMRSTQPGLKVGSQIQAGNALGYVGATGNVTGAHLHYAERRNGGWRKPIWGNRA